MYPLVGKENFTVLPGMCRLHFGFIWTLFLNKKTQRISVQALGQHFQTLVSKTVLPLSIGGGIHTRSEEL